MKDVLRRIYNDTDEEFYKMLDGNIKKNEKMFIITANPETLSMSEKDDELKKMLNDENNVLVPDGILIVKACKKIKMPVKGRITGIDIATHLIEYANENKKSLYLFGAKREVIESLVSIINNKYPNINLLGYKDGYVKDKDKVFEEIIELKPDICMVALGIPVQEKIIYKYIDSFKKGIFIGIGGSFDVLSGTKKRAPKIFIKLNLEWLYRIVTEPKRLKRFWNNNIKFLFKIKK